MAKWSSMRLTKPLNGGRTVSLTIGLGKSGCPHTKEWMWILIIYHTNINSKWIKELNLRPMSINLLEENIGKNPHEIDLGSDFSGMTQKA